MGPRLLREQVELALPGNAQQSAIASKYRALERDGVRLPFPPACMGEALVNGRIFGRRAIGSTGRNSRIQIGSIGSLVPEGLLNSTSGVTVQSIGHHDREKATFPRESALDPWPGIGGIGKKERRRISCLPEDAREAPGSD